MDKVVHFDIPADDAERAKKFYKSIFGWDISDVPGMPYWIVRTVKVDDKMMPMEMGAINGGIFKREDKAALGSQGPILVINVPNAKAYCQKIEKSGGKVIAQPAKVMEMGVYAKVMDTEGNVIGIWEDIKRH